MTTWTSNKAFVVAEEEEAEVVAFVGVVKWSLEQMNNAPEISNHTNSLNLRTIFQL